MLQYLVIQLDDTSVSYCHYPDKRRERRLISLDCLKKGIRFAMTENLMVQLVYPSYMLPREYKEVIDTIDHGDIVPAECEDTALREDADVIVYDGFASLGAYPPVTGSVCVLRTGKAGLFSKSTMLPEIISRVARLSVVITDMETFTEDDLKTYKTVLEYLSAALETLYAGGSTPQLNLLTDRMMLDGMNNCDAGWKSITLAPDGKFYVCPAFYLDEGNYGIGKSNISIGDLDHGPDIPNPQLYRLSHAPICRRCDAYQCKRCVWLNRRTTYEVNTPSHEQCVIAHLERNASRSLLGKLRLHGDFLPGHDIKEIDYLDPFEKSEEWR